MKKGVPPKRGSIEDEEGRYRGFGKFALFGTRADKGEQRPGALAEAPATISSKMKFTLERFEGAPKLPPQHQQRSRSRLPPFSPIRACLCRGPSGFIWLG
eukprot:5183844-Pyramimonas_sp.AAC.1